MYYNSIELMKLLFISKNTLYVWLRNNPDFPRPFKIGRRNLWKQTEVDEYLEKERTKQRKTED